MRALLIFLSFFISLVSVESEVLTLNDGRVLTGIYDEDKKSLTVVSGKVTAIITVKDGDIKSRKLLNPPSPERDFIAEASRFDEQQKAAEEQRKKRREEERVAAEAEADQLSAKMRASVIQRAEETAVLQSSPAGALQSSPAAREDARFLEEDRREIARRQAEADESRRKMVRKAEPEVTKLSQEAVERENDEMKRVESSLKFKKEQETARNESGKISYLVIVVLAAAFAALTIWVFPALLSRYRRRPLSVSRRPLKTLFQRSNRPKIPMELHDLVRPDHLVCRSCETTLSDQWNGISWVVNRILFVIFSLFLIMWLMFFAVPFIMLLLWIVRSSERPRCPKCRSRDCIPIDTPVGRKIVGGHDSVVGKSAKDYDAGD